MSHIFISYSKQDIAFVRYLKALLEAEGFWVWVDEARLSPSVRWWKTIEQNIDACVAFVVVMSRDAEDSDWVEREILRAESQNRPVFPILLNGDPWSRLANIQYEDMRAGLHSHFSAGFLANLRRVMSDAPEPTRQILFTIQEGNVLTTEADVLALKYAQSFYGADRVISEMLADTTSGSRSVMRAKPGEYRLIDTEGVLQVPQVLFVGTVRAREFNYARIRELSATTLRAVAETVPDATHLAMTIHGAGFGLDEVEAVRAQFAGYIDVLEAGEMPPNLGHITIVEINKRRVQRLQQAIDNQLVESKATYALPLEEDEDWGYWLAVPGGEDGPENQAEALDAGGSTAPVKPHAFVVMSHDERFDDFFYYGIQTPVHAAGLLCERIEQAEINQDILDQIKGRIDSANVVIIDMTHVDQNVYLQLGYAWGRGRPTIMVSHKSQVLLFEKETCLVYDKIRDLESIIAQGLENLRAEGAL